MKVNTVNGVIDIEKTNYILPHEHMAWWYDEPVARHKESAYRQMYEHYVYYYRELVKTHNCDVIIEHSPNFIDYNLAREVSRDSGMNIVLATGYYLEKWVIGRPKHFHEGTVEELADGMVRDILEGIKGTDMKAGFIKAAIDDINDEGDRKLLKAASLAQTKTGVSVSVHALSPEDRLGALNLMENAGVPPSKINVTHADAKGSVEESIMLARRGCNLVYTIWGITKVFAGFMDNLTEDFSGKIVARLVEEGYVDNIVFSVDYMASFDNVNGFGYWLYDVRNRNPLYAFNFIVPLLKKLGVSQKDIDHMMINNPRKMLEISL